MTKIVLYAALLGAAVFVPLQAPAFPHFTQNEFMTADSLDPGMTQTGIHLTLGEDYKSYYPVIRYGLGAFAEVGVKFGATSVDLGDEDRIGALLGVDFKYQLVKQAEGIPVDMAVNLGYDNTLVKSSNASEVTFSTILSRNYPLIERGYRLTPYGGIEMSSLHGSLEHLSDDTSFYLFGGFEWRLSQKFMIYTELKTGDYTQGGIAIRFEY